MKKLRLLFLMLLCVVASSAWAVEDDVHDMSITQDSQLNNNASIPSIEIDDPGYSIKQVQIGWKYNKDVSNIVTIEVSIGGTSLGSQTVGGKTTSTATFDASNLEGDIVISFTNHAGSGTGKGTFYVQSVKLVEGTATVSSSPLSSISLSGTYKTTFYQGDTFTHEGAIVTATYEDSSSKNVTSNAIFSTPDLTTLGVKTVNVTYTENDITKETSYDINVVEYVQTTGISITNWNTLFGTSFNGTISNASDKKPYEGIQDRLTVVYAPGTGSNMYMKDAELRLYNGTILSFEAPSGYVVTKVVFTGTIANDKMPTVDYGTYNYSSKTWTGAVTKVTFTGSATSANITSATVTLCPTATISANKEWITYTSKHALDFSEDITGLEGAYAITSHSAGATTLTATKMTGTVKAGTGLLLHAAAVDTEDAQVIAIPVAASGDEQTDNMLVGVTSATTVNPTDGTKTNLGLKSGSFVPYSAAGTLAAGKAYLQIPTADMPSNGSKLTIIFDDDETTGIDSIHNSQFTIHNYTPMFNLSGQKVSESYKGIVIVNGKKYIRK